MTTHELEHILAREGLRTIEYDGAVKHYIQGDAIYHCTIKNMFGVYKNRKGQWFFLVSDDARGVPYHVQMFGTETEACQALLGFARAHKLQKESPKNTKHAAA